MGSNNNRAAREAQRAEDARLAAIRNTQMAVNQAYDSPSRQAEIGDFVNSTRTFLGNDLRDQHENTQRDLMFALARNGLTGSSTEVDQKTDVGKEYARGLLEVDRKSRGAGAELEAQDQEARARLIALATSGLTATDGRSQAFAGMRSALEANRSTALAGGLGNSFGTFGTFLKDSRDAYERRRANRETGFGLYG